mmetsp:Transcript_40403/g.107137  ORF Transcript_40403/g.107137 Transcript_40403/m.107137 type:complete len:127 (-) Transcript_40403:102-482(-)|eukprot:CAMPEP_0194479120 /NCGR_PEP_ID=MMETSP0253-20130528/2347_1 /TAXON_ID=2966 /ORGANISM="Noctiluca scintillans" /LENGTH=126 /DNA_ID=CAMNT_0039318297 /DNA_START=90 /DNA_END=470 /DNA_ORIENTATION=+
MAMNLILVLTAVSCAPSFVAAHRVLTDTAQSTNSLDRSAAFLAVDETLNLADVPVWVKKAVVIQEQPEWNELPYPVNDFGSTGDGPAGQTTNPYRFAHRRSPFFNSTENSTGNSTGNTTENTTIAT